MRNLLKESDTRVNGHPISFVDIDETTMHTFAKVNVVKNGFIISSVFKSYPLYPKIIS